MLYLLQLVQALKFETPVPHVSSRQRSKQSSRTAALPAEAQLQTLEDFLIDRSVKNPVLGNHLYWYLMCEMEDESVGKMFKKVAFKFMTKIEEVTLSMFLSNFTQCFVRSRMVVYGETRSVGKPNLRPRFQSLQEN